MVRFKKISSDIKNKIPLLIKALKQDRNIEALYIFGSYARNAITPLSDIDIAILLSERVKISKYEDIKLNLLAKIVKILGTEEVDFVILNQAPYELSFAIIKEGKVLFCRNKNRLGQFKENSVLNYLDTQFLREERRAYLKNRLDTGRLGYDQAKHRTDFKELGRIFRKVKISI